MSARSKHNASGFQCEPVDPESHDFLAMADQDKEFHRSNQIEVIEEKVSEEDDFTSFKKSRRNYNSQLSP